MPIEEKCEKLEAAQEVIRAKYDAGVPLFTRDQFRDILQQLESGGNPERKVSITGLDGTPVHFQIKTGIEYTGHPFGDDYVCIM